MVSFHECISLISFKIVSVKYGFRDHRKYRCCFTSHRQRWRRHPHLLSLAKDVKLGFYTVPTGNQTQRRRVVVYYTTAASSQLLSQYETNLTVICDRCLVHDVILISENIILYLQSFTRKVDQNQLPYLLLYTNIESCVRIYTMCANLSGRGRGEGNNVIDKHVLGSYIIIEIQTSS